MGTFCLNGNTTELLLPTMHYSASRPRSRADRNGVRWRGLKIQTDSVAGLNCKPFYMKHKRICVFVGSRCSSSRFNQQRPSRVSYTLSCSNANFIRSHVDVFKCILRTHDDLKTLDIDVVKKMNLPSKRPNEQVSDQPLLTTEIRFDIQYDESSCWWDRKSVV